MARTKKEDMEEMTPQAQEEAGEETKAPVEDTEGAASTEGSGEAAGTEPDAPRLAEAVQALKKQNEMLEEQMQAMKEMLASTAPTVVQVTPDKERVHFLWQAEVANENIKTFGPGGMYGRIVGKTGSFYVPKSDLSRIMDEENRYFLDKRWLIVVSGLDEEEREALGVNYREGELLDKNAFARMVELGDRLLELYPELCQGHKIMVAQRYREAFEAGSPYVTRERALKLSDLTREAGISPNPFSKMVQEMNQRDADGE